MSPDPTATAAQTAWFLVCDGVQLSGMFTSREDAEAEAASWNSAYPASEGYAPFTVREAVIA